MPNDFFDHDTPGPFDDEDLEILIEQESWGLRAPALFMPLSFREAQTPEAGVPGRSPFSETGPHAGAVV
jgi:hypothetical protein